MDISEREVDRILDRLDQQDYIVDRALEETKAAAQAIALALDEHTKADHDQFKEINTKLEQLIEFQTKQKTALHMFMVAAGALSVGIGWVISLFFGK